MKVSPHTAGQRNKQGQVFNGYDPAISRKSKKRITETMRGWHLNRRVQLKLSDIAVEINAEVRGWLAFGLLQGYNNDK